MPESKHKKLYRKDELSNDSLYISIQDAEMFFLNLKLSKTQDRIREWIRRGLLVGRVRNLSPESDPRANRYEVFKPDIKRFKESMYA